MRNTHPINPWRDKRGRLTYAGKKLLVHLRLHKKQSVATIFLMGQLKLIHIFETRVEPDALLRHGRHYGVFDIRGKAPALRRG